MPSAINPIMLEVRRAALMGLALLGTACAAERARENARPSAPAPAQAVVTVPVSTPVPSAPEPPGLTILRNDCLSCHTEDLVVQQRLTEKQWVKVIDKMHKWGSPTEPENVDALTSYLATTYGAGAGSFVPRTLSPVEAAAAFERSRDGRYDRGDRGRGLTLYGDRCEPCHAQDGSGGPDGIALRGRHVIERTAEFAAIVRDGRGRMPGSGELSDAEIADLLAYLGAPTE